MIGPEKRGGRRPGAGRPRALNEIQRALIGLWIETERRRLALDRHEAILAERMAQSTAWIERSAREFAAERRVEAQRMLAALARRDPQAAKKWEPVFRDGLRFAELGLKTGVRHERVDRRYLRLPHRLRPPPGATAASIKAAAKHFRVSASTATKALEALRALRRADPGLVFELENLATPKALLQEALLPRRARIEGLFWAAGLLNIGRNRRF